MRLTYHSYNAAVFKIIKRSAYLVTLYDVDTLETWHTEHSLQYNLKRLETSEWREIYKEAHVSRHGNLYLGIDRVAFPFIGPSYNYSLSYYLPRTVTGSAFVDFQRVSAEGWATSEWLSSGQNLDLPMAIHMSDGYTIEPESGSRIQLNLYFMIVVLLCNVFKLAIMVYTLLKHHSDSLVTLGDAASSFLQRPEGLTESRCTLSTQELFDSYGEPSKNDAGAKGSTDGTWRPRVRKYCSSIGFDKAWAATISYDSMSSIVSQLMYRRVACLTLVLVVFPTRVNNFNHKVWKWGTSSEGSLTIGSDKASSQGTIWNAWLSNLPQVLLSLCYLNLNTICNSMASSREWNTLATSRRGLRVTRPFGEQRSTYFLQLPYKWAVPLMIMSGFLHWLLSQAFFLIRIDYYDANGGLDKWASACGISLSSLCAFFFVSLIIVFALLMIGRWPMYTRLPLAENCSLMISAACHPASDEIDPHLAKVQWGVVPDMKVTGREHCSLSSKSVTKPVVGKVYH